MTSQQPEGVALEQKMQPVPSSGEMALDLEINGTSSNRDETTSGAASDELDPLASKPTVASSAVDFASETVVNGSINNDAFASNATIGSDPISRPDLELSSAEVSTQPTDPSSSLPLPSETITTTTTITEERVPSSEPQPEPSQTSPLLEAADAAIESAIEDLGSSSAVPPVVDAQQSDLRSSTPVPPPHLTSESTEELQASDDLDLDISAPLSTEPLPEQVNTIADVVVESEPADTISTPSDSLAPAQSSVDADSDLPQTTNDRPTPSNTKMEVDASPAPANADPGFDISMDDVPPAKVAREREDDDESGPSAKRTKTENGDSASAQTEAIKDAQPVPLTAYQSKEVLKVVKAVIRLAEARNFKSPVAVLWPGLADAYLAKIQNPIDLGTIETRLKDDAYATLDDFKGDLQLMVDNSITYNTEDHEVTRGAKKVRDNILSKIANIPAEPPVPVKKEKKPKRSTPMDDGAARAPPPPRQARVVSDASPAQTFALNPQTSTPLIRRDSTKGDGGRPKREIHPPKNKDLPYSVRPKSKKFDTELKWCAEVLNEMRKPKYYAFASAFYHPVDPVALGIPTYFSVIKTPMDMSTIQNKLDNGEYANSKEFEKDVRLIFDNCYKFNPPPNIVNQWGKQLEEVYRSMLSGKAQWIAEHAPAARSHSPTPDSDEEESEDEPEAAATNNNASAALNQRLVEEQAKLIELMNSKNTDPQIIQMQKDMVQLVQARVAEEAEKAATAPKKAKKPKTTKPTNKKNPAPKKPVTKKSGGTKAKYMGTLEKEVISAGIGALPDHYAEQILEMIKADSPNVDVDGDGNVELDIDSVSVPTLWKIYELVTKHAPEVEVEIRRQIQEREAPAAPARPPQKKKNKPMSKNEQERKIEQLKSAVQNFERQASGSQEPLPTVEGNVSSGDEDSDSEEE